MTKFKEFSDTIEVNGKKLDVRVNIYTKPCDSDPLESIEFENEVEKTEFAQQFESGELLNLLIQVTVTHESTGIIGSDTIGNCIIDSLDDLPKLIEEYEMVESAKGELIEELRQVYTSLKGIFQ